MLYSRRVKIRLRTEKGPLQKWHLLTQQMLFFFFFCTVRCADTNHSQAGLMHFASGSPAGSRKGREGKEGPSPARICFLVSAFSFADPCQVTLSSQHRASLLQLAGVGSQELLHHSHVSETPPPKHRAKGDGFARKIQASEMQISAPHLRGG